MHPVEVSEGRVDETGREFEVLFETDRLRVRLFRADDAPVFNARFQADPDVLRYSGKPRNLAQTEGYVAQAIRWTQANSDGYGTWAIEEKTSGALCGWISLGWHEGRENVETAYAIAKARWGRGLATEAVCGMLRYAFDELGLAAVAAAVHPENRASIRVLEKAGLRKVEAAASSHYGPLDFYAIARPTQDVP